MALPEIWDRVWFRPASPLGPLAARTLLSAQALWILLSRPDLPDLVSWPPEFWRTMDPFLPLRFAIVGLPLPAERALFVVLHGSLAGALLGIAPRLSCGLSALLLYHFAPFEELVAGMPHTCFGGLTLPVLGLFILSFSAAPRWGERDASPEYRWPVVLIQLLFSFSYFFPGLAKLRFAGLGWFTADNIRGWAILNYPITHPPWALWVASSSVVCWALALATMTLELLFPLVVFSRTAARILVPLALLFHFGILETLRYVFLSAPLLLLFLDWDALHRRWGPRAERPS